MSACHIVNDRRLYDLPFCMVHGNEAPCPDEGRPALPDPVHVFSLPDQVDAVENARAITAGSRPIVVHKGHQSDATSHMLERGAETCWCQPTTIPSG